MLFSRNCCKESTGKQRIVDNQSEYALLIWNEVERMRSYQAGVDIGSTTVKLVLLDEKGSMVWGEYRRHGAKTQETLADMLRQAREQLGPCEVRLCMTGSGAISLAEALHVGFVQEVVDG